MSNPDRLAHLRRQRALLQEHLAWLEREITSAEQAGVAASEPDPDAVTETNAPGATFLPTSTAFNEAPLNLKADAPALPKEDEAGTSGNGDANVNTILEEYRTPTSDLQRNVRTGCFLYFAAALLVVAVLVTILYFALPHK